MNSAAPRRWRMRSSSKLEVLEGDRLALHPEPEVGHEDQVGVRAAGDEGVAITAEERRRVVRLEPHLAHRGRGVLQEPAPEGVVGLEREEAPIQAIGRSRREAVVWLVVHTAHSTTALPWCHEGS